MRNRRSEGSRYEDLACGYLRRKGYKILDRNVYLMRKELDIVALDGDTVVFIEVKGRRTDAFGLPAEAVDRAKQRRILGVATAYLKKNRLRDRHCRFDVVGVRSGAEGKLLIDHIENAFDAWSHRVGPI